MYSVRRRIQLRQKERATALSHLMSLKYKADALKRNEREQEAARAQVSTNELVNGH